MNEVCGPTTVQQTLCYRYHQSTISMHPIISNILTRISLFQFLSPAKPVITFYCASLFFSFSFLSHFSFVILLTPISSKPTELQTYCRSFDFYWKHFSNELRKDSFIITKGRLEPIVFSKSFEISLQYSDSRLKYVFYDPPYRAIIMKKMPVLILHFSTCLRHMVYYSFLE